MPWRQATSVAKDTGKRIGEDLALMADDLCRRVARTLRELLNLTESDERQLIDICTANAYDAFREKARRMLPP